MRRYETIFILRLDIGEAQIKQSLKRVSDIVSNGGGEWVTELNTSTAKLVRMIISGSPGAAPYR